MNRPGKLNPFLTLRGRFVLTSMLVALMPITVLAYINNLNTKAALLNASNRALYSAAVETASKPM